MSALDVAFEVANELEQSGDLEAALVSYQSLMDKDVRAAINTGVIHFNRQHYGLAADALRQAVKLDPNYALAWFNLGNAFRELNRTGEAVKAYESALRISPSYTAAHFNLALLLDTARNPRRALKHWKAYVRLDPTGKSAQQARRAIKKTVSSDRLKIVWRRA